MRSFIQTLRRSKLASILNILGLSFAFAAFMFIMVQVYYEFTAGTDDPRSERIYRLDMQAKGDDKLSINIFMPIVEQFLETTPAVEASARWLYFTNSIEVDGVIHSAVKSIQMHDDASKVFQVDMVEGVFASALEPNSMVLSRSAALRFFGTDKVIGRTVKFGDQYTVTGVCGDLPQNSLLSADIYTSSLNKHVATLFVLLRQGSDPQKIAEDFYENNKERYANYVFGPVSLVAAADTYFANQNVDNSFVSKGNRTTTLILFMIAILVIVIAAINFVNFSTALAPVRIKGLNIRAVLGSTRLALRADLIGNAVLFALLSFVVAVLIYSLAVDTALGGLLKVGELSLVANLPVLLITVAVVVVVGLVAGVYPAYYCTRFDLASVLSGGSGVTVRDGAMLRKVLITLQFVVSIALIIAALTVNMQSEHLKNHPLGYDSQNVVVVSGLYDKAKLEQVTQRVGALPFVSSNASYNGAFGVYQADLVLNFENLGDTMRFGCYMVDENFIPTMGIPLIKGRNFTAQDRCYFETATPGTERVAPIIVNQEAFMRFGVALDSVVHTRHDAFRIIGVTGNILTHSLYDLAGPMAFVRNDENSKLLFRIDPLTPADQAADQIRQIVKQVEPIELWRANAYHDELAQMYAKENDLSLVVVLFSLLAVVISLSGVFGLVLFETQHRRREIGLRKVYGSTTGEVLQLFTRRFACILLISFLIAAPAAWWGLMFWLGGFPYRTSIPWWVFVSAFAVVMAITLLTVIRQSYRAANENPIDSINS